MHQSYYTLFSRKNKSSLANIYKTITMIKIKKIKKIKNEEKQWLMGYTLVFTKPQHLSYAVVLQLQQPRIGTFRPADQLAVAALFHDPPVLHHSDAIHPAYGR